MIDSTSRPMLADRTLDLSLILLGAALPLSLAASNAALGLLTLGLLLALNDSSVRARAANRLKEAARTPLFAALCLYAAAALLAAISGLNPWKSLSIWPKDIHKLWVVLIVGASLDERRRVLFVRGLAAGAAAAALVGVAQSLSAAVIIAFADSGWISDIARPFLRAHGFMHPVSFGESLGLAFLGLMIVGEDDLPRNARRATLAALALVLVLNQTRAAQLGVVAGFAVVAALKRRWRKPFGAIVIAGLAIAGAWEFIVPNGRSLRDLLSFQGPQAARLTLWRVAWKVFRDHPWTGVGAGQYRTVFSSYFSGALDHERDWGNAHNIFLHQAAERGLAGLAALAAVCAALGAETWKRARSNADEWAFWSLAACTAFLVMNMTETAFQTEQVATLFLVVVLLPAAGRTRAF